MRTTVFDLLVGFSVFSAGVAAFLFTVNLRAYLRGQGRVMLAFALARLGYAITIGLITESLLKVPGHFVPVTWRVVLYLVGLVIAAIGLLGIAFYHREEER